MNETGLEIRRRVGLMAVVAVAALALAVLYLWRFAETGGGVPLLVGLVLGVVAVFHGLAWGDARTPLLVADETGLRVRLGGDWTGIPWSHVDRVEVDERGRVADGHVAVHVTDTAGPLEHARWRSRLGAAMNRWFYDSPLVVPYGLTTIVTTADVPSTLRRLAEGRASIVVLDDEAADPEPTVALTTTASAEHPEGPTVARDAGDLATGGAAATEEPGPDPDGEAVEPEPSVRPRKPRRSLITARETAPSLPLAKVVAALRSHPARREEVRLPVRREPATSGNLALSEPYADTVDLPEIEHLRRGDERPERQDEHRSRSKRQDVRHGSPVNRQDDDHPVSNVSLIIDATTDLSARAMSKVRREVPLAASPDLPRDPVSREDFAVTEPLVIGDQLRTARERLGLDVDGLAERTRIRPYVIESIEVDDFRPCGGDFYAKGHLRMLARVLGLDPEPLLAAYDETFASSPVDPRAVFDAELSTAATGMVRGGARGTNWSGLIAAVLVLVLIWGVARYFAGDTTPTTSDVVAPQNSAGLGSPGPGDKPLPQPKVDGATVRVAAVGGDARVVVKNHAGKVVFAGHLEDGGSRLVTGRAPLHVKASDGGVVRLTTKGHHLGVMGTAGEPATTLVRAHQGPAH